MKWQRMVDIFKGNYVILLAVDRVSEIIKKSGMAGTELVEDWGFKKPAIFH